MSRHDHLDREDLIRLLQRHDAEREFGRVWGCDQFKTKNIREQKGHSCAAHS
jgi:hypothetical protein